MESISKKTAIMVISVGLLISVAFTIFLLNNGGISSDLKSQESGNHEASPQGTVALNVRAPPPPVSDHGSGTLSLVVREPPVNGGN